MTQREYDTLLKELRVLQTETKNLASLVSKQSLIIENLSNKTVVITTVGEDIEQLKLDVKALKDEKEM